MHVRSLILGAAALVLTASSGFAADYLGGAVKSADIDGKQVLTGANGLTLYVFDKDAEGVTNCYDDCAVNWPPLFVEGDAQPEGDFTIVERTDGTRMWAYKDWPLYYWINDKAPGDVTGDGVGGVWHLAIE